MQSIFTTLKPQIYTLTIIPLILHYEYLMTICLLLSLTQPQKFNLAALVATP
jgi:hypothetical protein